ncbi:hypothetical protein ABTY98_33915 [Streptomyces sp. NPDC096040]|uniref:hypothetical protein n=1 Tax=Streptomyces sp. NPDC096040 TaxID=3155541 RepID=UPI003324EEDA
MILAELTHDGVMLLTLNRPERHNAWTREFCPGMDMSVLDGASSGARPWPTDRLPPRTRSITFPSRSWRPSTAPALASASTRRRCVMCASPEAKFAATFRARGLVAGDGVA